VDGTDAPGSRLLELVRVMDRLRVNCPWDAQQTHESLTPYLLEETYEAVEALDGGDPRAIREELGDVLLQVVFHARVAAERDDGTGFTIDDVADGIISKLTRRHPHVFGDTAVAGAHEVTANWDAIKAAERTAAGGGRPPSALDGVPLAQPALALALALQRRAQRAGAPAELADELAGPSSGPGGFSSGEPGSGTADIGSGTGEARPVSATGAELFAAVTRARAVGLDPERELRAAARAYGDRVRAWERATAEAAEADETGESGETGEPGETGELSQGETPEG
jgi:XTP/dITP diphosphohydrolase